MNPLLFVDDYVDVQIYYVNEMNLRRSLHIICLFLSCADKLCN